MNAIALQHFIAEVPENTLRSNGLLRTVRESFTGRGEGGRWEG